MSTQVKQRPGRHSGSLADTKAALDAWAADMESAVITAADTEKATGQQARYGQPSPSWTPGYQAQRCECGHTSGQHRVVAAGLNITAGVCMTLCGCRAFTEATA